MLLVLVNIFLRPSAKAGAIIGKQGSTLKEIRESTGARVEVLAAAQAPEFAQMRRGSLESGGQRS